MVGHGAALTLHCLGPTADFDLAIDAANPDGTRADAVVSSKTGLWNDSVDTDPNSPTYNTPRSR